MSQAAGWPRASTERAFRAMLVGARSALRRGEPVTLVGLDGRVIYAKNADNERAPASLVKLMTLSLACEDLDAGRADVDEIVSVSRHAATVGRYRMGLRTGEEVPLHVLLEGVAIASANDAASALAQRPRCGYE